MVPDIGNLCERSQSMGHIYDMTPQAIPNLARYYLPQGFTEFRHVAINSLDSLQYTPMEAWWRVSPNAEVVSSAHLHAALSTLLNGPSLTSVV